MNTPKKPGTDLAALKARLAKKHKEPEGPAGQPPPSEVSTMAAPLESRPPAEPEGFGDPMSAQDLPAPGQSSTAGSRSQVAPVPAQDDPFSSPVNPHFDPTPSYADVGDVPVKSNVGLTAFIAVIFLGAGVGVGWLSHKILAAQETIDQARAKGDEMYNEIKKVIDARVTVAMSLEDLQKAVATDPEAGAQKITDLLAETFEKHPQVESLFGPHLANINSRGVKKTFELYREADRVEADMRALAGFLSSNAPALKAAGGPVVFGVMIKDDKARMVSLIEPLCGDNPAKPETLQACSEADKAVAFKVKETLGGKEKVVPRGTGDEQVLWLAPEGDIYNYAVGQEPAKNAQRVRDFMMSRVSGALDKMHEAGKAAEAAMKDYSVSGGSDGSSSPAAPE